MNPSLSLRYLRVLFLLLYTTIHKVHGEAKVTPENLERMKTAEWTNYREVARDVGFVTNGSFYPEDIDEIIDVTIEHANCYVAFQNPSKTKYDLITATEPPPDPAGYGVFLTHERPCGVCSNLVDLAVYLETPDLYDPVRLCGIQSFLFGDGATLSCLKNVIGFSEMCASIWEANSRHSRDICACTCIFFIASPSNQADGLTSFLNPCRPVSEGGSCANTINQLPVCDGFQYEVGNEYRLNPCLQCDECRSGPIFQKIAGRTRRGSGIESGIRRPDIPTIDHNYFTADINYTIVR